jgi:hypothetical protein
MEVMILLQSRVFDKVVSMQVKIWQFFAVSYVAFILQLQINMEVVGGITNINRAKSYPLNQTNATQVDIIKDYMNMNITLPASEGYYSILII